MTLANKIEEDFTLLQSAIEGSREIVIVLSEALQVKAFNKRATTVVAQFEGKDLRTGESIGECIPVADPELLRSLVDKALTGETSRLTHFYYVRKRQKRWFDITFQPLRSGDSILPYVIVFATDVTYKKEENSRVRDLELGFSSIFQQVAVGVMLYDVQYNPIRVNKKFTELTGYTLDDYRKQGAWSITHPDYMEESMELAARMLNGELECYELEKKYIHKNGHEVWIHLTATVVNNQDKVPRQIISVVQDISAQKFIEKELVAKNEELDNFVFKAAHDLKGPIASLLGLHSIVETEEFEDENAMFYFRHYNTNVLRLNYVLENLIELARVKEASLKTEPVNVMEIVEQNMSALKHIEGYE
ncbi:MAG: PAS domain S-box protein, partial [Cyclobacteriaceae bacterium]